MASTGIIQRRYTKAELVASPPLTGEIVFAIDTEEFGTLINGETVWKKYEDIIKSVNGKIGHVVITKEELGLSNIDNTSDIDKPVSTATQNLINLHTTNKNNPHEVSKLQLGLGNVDNTSDIDKPISTATQQSIDTKLDVLGTSVDSNRLNGYTADYYIKNGDVYTKSESDNLLNNKVNINDIYTKIIIDQMMDDKADINSVYTKVQSDNKYEVNSNKGIASGYASLGIDGKVPPEQLPPEQAKDIIIVDDDLSLPGIGEEGAIYITKDNDNMYIYDNTSSSYSSISTTLGETSTTAYRGDRGSLAYDHTLNMNNPHNTTANGIGAVSQSDFDSHTQNTNNPHYVTADEVGAYTKSETDDLFANYDSEYIRTQPSDITVGYAQAGTLFNGSVQDALDRIFFNYPVPLFESFYIDGIPKTIEYDNVIPSGNYIANWTTTNTQNIKPVSISISHGADIYGSNLSNNGNYQITIPSDISSSTVGTERFTIKMLNTRNEIISSNFDIQWLTPTANNTIVYNDNITTIKNTPITIDVLANDTDSDGPVSIVNTVYNGNNGTTILNSDGTITYTPNYGYSGNDSFTYTNTEGTTGTVYVTINITKAIDDNISVIQDTSIDINVISNDINADGAPLSVDTITQPSHGSTIINSDGTIKYSPVSAYYGTDSFTYTNTAGNTATVSINVMEYTTAPVYYGLWEYNTAPLSSTELNGQYFTKLINQNDASGTYSYNAKAFDKTDSNWDGSNNGEGAYHTIVYPASMPLLTHFVDNSNSLDGGWTNDNNITINGIDYVVARTSNVQYAGDYSYTLS